MKDLSPREQQILELISNGYTNQQIAIELCTSAKTVMHQVSSIRWKLGARNRAHCVTIGYKVGYLKVRYGESDSKRDMLYT